MATDVKQTMLADRQYVTLILRLTLDRTGQLIQGDLLDTTNAPQQRFTGMPGLHQALEDWLRQREQPGAPTEP